MIKSFTITNYLGESIKLRLGRPEETGLLILPVTGLGPGKANINIAENSISDGASYNSSRLPQRNIVFNLKFVDTEDYQLIENIRQKTYKYFPIKKKLKILVETDNRTAEITGYVESNEPNIFDQASGTQISIICPDPYFYSVGPNGDNATLFYGVEPLLEFPFSNESTNSSLITLGNIKNLTESYITYQGDAEVGIIIHIHALGEVTNLAIHNTVTRKVMRIDTVKLQALTGSVIKAGDDITIDTRLGYQTITLVRDGENINILNCLGRNISWLRLVKGDNIFAFTADTGTTELQFWIENKVLYEGI